MFRMKTNFTFSFFRFSTKSPILSRSHIIGGFSADRNIEKIKPFKRIKISTSNSLNSWKNTIIKNIFFSLKYIILILKIFLFTSNIHG
jgi:hypothetical protein